MSLDRMAPVAAIAVCVLASFCASLPVGAAALNQGAPDNPNIDMQGYLAVAREAAGWRDARRLSEAEFQRISRLPDTIVLDARSAQKYEELHIRNAVNLSFPDITVASLARLIPDKNARILIYCNNNFRNAEGPFPTKLSTASLNLSTFIALYNYGYRNVYELGPQIDFGSTILEFERDSGAPTR